jgi:hypothetical protein
MSRVAMNGACSSSAMPSMPMTTVMGWPTKRAGGADLA